MIDGLIDSLAHGIVTMKVETAMMQEPETKRWTARRKAELIRQMYKGQKTVNDAAREFDLTPSEIERWIQDAEAGMESALKTDEPLPRVTASHFDYAHSSPGSEQEKIRPVSRCATSLRVVSAPIAKSLSESESRTPI